MLNEVYGELPSGLSYRRGSPWMTCSAPATFADSNSASTTPSWWGRTDVMATGLAYGNRAGMLPYTVLVDREGIVRWTYLGEIKREQLLAQIQPRCFRVDGRQSV